MFVCLLLIVGVTWYVSYHRLGQRDLISSSCQSGFLSLSHLLLWRFHVFWFENSSTSLIMCLNSHLSSCQFLWLSSFVANWGLIICDFSILVLILVDFLYFFYWKENLNNITSLLLSNHVVFDFTRDHFFSLWNTEILSNSKF